MISSPVLLFVDIDGVVHGLGKQAFSCLPLLVDALVDLPVELVITSSWRDTHNLDALRTCFGELGSRIVGVTPRLEQKWPPYVQYVRYVEILGYLQTQPHRQWLALDDDASLFPRGFGDLVLCKAETGLDTETVKRLKSAVILKVGHY